jgi:hybrid cluster-associated redox disulfide protein
MSISKDMPIFEVLQLIPEAADVFIEYGMGCVNCFGAASESIERGARNHGVDLEQLMEQLNKLGVKQGN